MSISLLKRALYLNSRPVQQHNEYLVCSGEMGVDFGAAARQTGIQRGAELFLSLTTRFEMKKSGSTHGYGVNPINAF